MSCFYGGWCPDTGVCEAHGCQQEAAEYHREQEREAAREMEREREAELEAERYAEHVAAARAEGKENPS